MFRKCQSVFRLVFSNHHDFIIASFSVQEDRMPKHSIEKSCRYHKFIGNSRNKKECVFLCNREFPGISCCIKRLPIHISTDMDPQSFSIYFYLLFLSLVRKQRCGKVSVAGIRKQCHDRLSCIFRSLRKFNCCPDRRTRGNSHEDSFLLSN